MKGTAKERDPHTEAAREYFQVFNTKAGHVCGLLRFVLLDGARDAGGAGELVRLLILIISLLLLTLFSSLFFFLFFFLILLHPFTLYS